MFSKTLIEYTEQTLNEEKISLRTKTMVKNVTDKYIEAEVTRPDGTREKQIIPYGLLVWATGNAVRPVVRDLIAAIGPAQKNSRRGLAVNDYLVVEGTEGIWALGDCSVTKYAPTAQVASQQGAFLARLFNNMAKSENLEQDLKQLEDFSNTAPAADKEALEKEIQNKEKNLKKVKKLSPFEYTHQGSLAYIGMERAVADVATWNGNIASGGGLTYLFWRSAYLSMCFSTRNRVLVALDWIKVSEFYLDAG